jgi:hypothetical protein
MQRMDELQLELGARMLQGLLPEISWPGVM